MKSHLPAALLFLSLSGAAFAVTDAEITPAALAGKKLTFTIATAGGDFANTGSWSGTFETTPANGFTVKNIDGNTADISTTHSTALTGGMTVVTLPVIVAGSPPATISLRTVAGVGRYELNFTPLDASYQIGTFTIGAAVVEKPEIMVMQPAKSELTDGKTKKSFGSVKVGKKGSARKFTIKNNGGATLDNLAIKKTGADKSSFVVGDLGASSLAPGASTSFKVSFKPSGKGTRKAAIEISSNDADENPFDIKLTGAGVVK